MLQGDAKAAATARTQQRSNGERQRAQRVKRQPIHACCTRVRGGCSGQLLMCRQQARAGQAAAAAAHLQPWRGWRFPAARRISRITMVRPGAAWAAPTPARARDSSEGEGALDPALQPHNCLLGSSSRSAAGGLL